MVAVLAAAAIAAPAAVVTAQSAPSAAQRDWTRTVATTPEGGFRIGNPNAPVKLVEYLSLTCPHCAHFARDSKPALLRDHVRGGRVSLELRNYVLNGSDAAATMLARCAGTAGYFPLSEAYLEAQPQWLGRIQAIPPEQRQELMTLSSADRLVRLAEIGGLLDIAARHGVSAAAGRRCLTDQAAFNRLGEMREAAAALGVGGTPTFFINSAVQRVNDWPSIERQIRQAGD